MLKAPKTFGTKADTPKRVSALLFFLLVPGCVSEQADRVKWDDHLSLHAEYDKARPEELRTVADKAAVTSAKDTDARLRESFDLLFKSFKTNWQKEVDARIEDKGNAITGLVEALQTAFTKYREDARKLEHKRQLEEIRHEAAIDEKVKGIDARVIGATVSVGLVSAANELAKQERTKALVAFGELKGEVERNTEDQTIIKREINNLHDDFDVFRKSSKEAVNDANVTAGEADDKSENAKMVAWIALVGGLTKLGIDTVSWLRARKDK